MIAKVKTEEYILKFEELQTLTENTTLSDVWTEKGIGGYTSAPEDAEIPQRWSRIETLRGCHPSARESVQTLTIFTFLMRKDVRPLSYFLKA